MLALTDCGMSLGLLWLFLLGALFGPWQTVVLLETVKVQLTTNMIMLRIALKTCFQDLVNLFEKKSIIAGNKHIKHIRVSKCKVAREKGLCDIKRKKTDCEIMSMLRL